MTQREQPQNPLHERYASRQMAGIFSARHRLTQWRRMWICLAEAQQELGLPITDEQLEALRQAAPTIDLERVAAIERETRHDVVAHLRHYSEQAGEAGAILHLGATSAFVTDNTDTLLTREALEVIEQRIATVIRNLAGFAEETRSIPTLAYTHLQPAQLTTVGKRACLWIQDFLVDLEAVRHHRANYRCRGAKGTTGTQASYLTLFEGDSEKVRTLDRRIAEKLGFAGSFPVTGQTYTRKQDSQTLAVLAGVAESCHKFGTDVRLLQGLGELSEPFETKQVGSSAMAYKRNPIRAERMCGLSRKLMSDSLNGPLNTATQWLERSLDDSSNRRLVIPDAFLLADAVLNVAANIGGGLVVREHRTATRVARELPFMATEEILMKATVSGGDRQHLHERIREHSMAAHGTVEKGEVNPLIDLIAADSDFGLSRDEFETLVRAERYTGRSAEQVLEFLNDAARPAVAEVEELEAAELRV